MLNTIEYTNCAKMYTSMGTIEFASWLQIEMNKRGWSNSELARKAGVTRGAIGNVLRGDRNIGSELCRAIAQAFDIPADDVFRIAGILPQQNLDNPVVKEGAYLLSLLTDPRKQQALDYLRFLVEMEERAKQ